MPFTTERKTIGTDNGTGDIFFADVEYHDGNTGRIVVYSRNLQMASTMLRVYAGIWNFTVINLA
jgi:hypothetical protein